MRSRKLHLRTAEELLDFGRRLGASLEPDAVLALSGELGAGKTTLVKGIASSAVGWPEEEVSSPTFIYLNIYGESKKLYHFDLYRLEGPEEFLSMGFDETFASGGICCIEWAEKIGPALPSRTLYISLEHSSLGGRDLRIDE